METATLLLLKVQKKLKKIKRHITHLEYKVSILSVKSLNNLLDVSEDEIKKELKEIEHEIEISENLYYATKFEYDVIRITIVAMTAMIAYIIMMYI